MKKMGVLMLAMILVLSVMAPITVLAEPAEGPTQLAQARGTPGRTAAPARAPRVTQAEFARILVQLLGLGKYVPVNGTPQDDAQALMQEGIAPADGWMLDDTVTRGVLAVVMVKVMKAMGYEVDIDMNDTRAAMDWLNENGIPTGTITQSAESVEPLGAPNAPNVFQVSTDPLVTRELYGSVDAPESGADAGTASRGPETAGYEPVTMEEIIAVVPPVSRPERPTTPPTPFRP